MSIKFNIDIDYKRKPTDEEEKLDYQSNSEITYSCISAAVNQKHKEGLNSVNRRTWGRLQNKFETAIMEEKKDIAIEESELDFIKDSFKDWKSPTGAARLVNILEDYVESMSKS